MKNLILGNGSDLSNGLKTSYDDFSIIECLAINEIKNILNRLFGYLNAGRISIENYVNELPMLAFNHIIDFWDTIEYFAKRKKI